MRTIPSALQAHLDGDVTTLAVCWKVVRRDAVEILGTEHDRDLTISSGTYAGTYVAQAGITGSNVRSTADMSVDNLEVTGAVNTGDLTLVDLTAADIEAGLLDDASVTLFLVNWQAPDDGQIVLRTGTLGEIHRTAEGQYRTELRGLTQALSRPIVRSYGVACDADLFDSRCALSAAAYTFDAEVTAVTSRRAFDIDITFGSPEPADPAALLTGGLVAFVTGENAGFSMEVKAIAADSPGYAVTLYLPMPVDIGVGDTLTIRAGCDKRLATCRDQFANLVNFRGHGVYTPGANEILKVGGQDRSQ
jgi:uncharacterized phage protein (TIGR02218 family)